MSESTSGREPGELRFGIPDLTRRRPRIAATFDLATTTTSRRPGQWKSPAKMTSTHAADRSAGYEDEDLEDEDDTRRVKPRCQAAGWPIRQLDLGRCICGCKVCGCRPKGPPREGPSNRLRQRC